MATLAVTNTFSAGTTIVASEMNTNFDDIEAFVNTTPGVVQADIVDAKGDIVAASAADTVSRLAVGTDTYVLTADSGEATGLKWAAPTTGDVTGVAAGSGLAGGGSSGDVTLTVDVDTKGDILVATAGDTVAKLGVGSNDQVLTADSAEASGVKWATVSAGTSWSGSTANGLATYGSASTIVAESTATYDGTTLELTQSGGGLKMDGLASADANTLDDYEEGEWNPTFVCGTSGTITATNDTFSYTKVGRLVNVQGRADTFTVSSPLGGLSIGSLPFAIADTTERSERGSFSAVAIGLTADRNNIMGYYVAGSGLYINYGNGLTGTGGASMAASIDAGSILIINATYCAAT